MDKFSSKVHRVHMELGGKLPNSLRIETQFFERLQSVGVVDGAAHTQKDDVKSNGGSLENASKHTNKKTKTLSHGYSPTTSSPPFKSGPWTLKK